MLSILNDLKARAELLKSLIQTKDWWALADAALDAAKKVKSLWEDLSDGLFHSVNPNELAEVEKELDEALFALKLETAFKFEANTKPEDPKAIDPIAIITLVTVVLDLIKKWRENRKK